MLREAARVAIEGELYASYCAGPAVLAVPVGLENLMSRCGVCPLPEATAWYRTELAAARSVGV